MDQTGFGDEFLELGHKWCMGIVGHAIGLEIFNMCFWASNRNALWWLEFD